ncbi:MAG: hydroxymethylglutaryl-CoA lyase [Spirochaetales bacterium]|jgi:hydroxymethylglutaryl-CoA lyase|nr:hydroxymethylglutaryl-CoA lyase [Spirochaetales bacterium]
MDIGAFPKEVEIFEVGPRDGLQPEPVFIDTRKKIEYVNMLTEAGCRKIEVSSFVHPKWVPQLADVREVFAGITRREGVTYSALVPNLRGLELAAECGVTEVVTIVSTSESHNRKNLNVSPAETLGEIQKINAEARRRGIRVRSYIATVFGCPIEGEQDPAKALDTALALESFGAYEISLGDTTGMANPVSAFRIPAMIASRLTTARLAVHYHQHFGLEHANNFASLQAGITSFDGAAGGLGGCPYAPGATGNCATEIMTQMFRRMGIETGIDSAKIGKAAEYAKTLSTLIHGKCGV